ncbi:MAG: NADase-type glycan-binding domain-containing protein, partial [Acidimicrobiales bacterium]
FVRPGDELVTALITRALLEPPPDLRPLGVPDAVAAAVERALAKEPGGRQSTASQLAAELVSSSTATGSPSTGPAPAAANTVIASPAVGNPPVGNPAVGNPAHAASATGPETGQPTAQQTAQPTAVAPSFAPPSPPADGVSGLAGSPTAQEQGPPERGSRAVWVVVAALAAAVVILGAVLVGTGGDGGDDGSPNDAADVTSAGQDQPTESRDEQATTSSSAPAETTSAEAETTTSTSASTTVSTTAPIVERDLTASATAFASSSAPSGNDACGEITTFDPDNVLDGRRTTAWRTSGDGRGEVLEFALSQRRSIVSVGLVPGYAKLDLCDGADRFYENRRITEVEWVIGDSVVRQRLNPDQPDMQVLRLDEPVDTEIIFMTIVSTTASGGRDFTAVSDVEIIGG